MKKIIKAIVLVLCVCLGALGLMACGGEKEILVISREAGSGTRDAFDSLVKNSNGDSLAKTVTGEIQSSSIFVKSLNIQNGTSQVMTHVSSVKNSIGYISLGSVNDMVKTINVNGVEPNAESVLNNTYNLQRPFVLMTNKNIEMTVAAKDFLSYLNSSTAQEVVKKNKYVAQKIDSNGDTKVAYVAPTAVISGKILLKGSTSVEPIMNSLIQDYLIKGGAKVAETVKFDLDAQGTSAGISAVKSDTTGTVIGMGSSNMKEADKALLNYNILALDAIAIIVNKANTITNLSIAQLFDIYTGAIVKFSQI